MLTATAYLTDGLDLVVEFLARAQPDKDAVCARYPGLNALQDASAMLRRWAVGLPGADAIAGDEARLCLSVPMTIWQGLYARALSTGMPVAPDRIGLATLGAGGMLATLELVLEHAAPALAQPMTAWNSHPDLASDRYFPTWSGLVNGTLVAMDWQPLRELLLRDAQLCKVAQQMPILKQPPQTLTENLIMHGFVIERPQGRELLLCRPAWRGALLQTLRHRFLEHALLLFRLMFIDWHNGWGLDPDSRLMAGYAELLAHGEEIGFGHFGSFGIACAEMAALQDFHPQSAMRQPLGNAMRDLMHEFIEFWPDDYLGGNQSLAALYAGWMLSIDASAQVAPDAALEPCVKIAAGAVVAAGARVRIGAHIGAGVSIPAGVIAAPGARIKRLELNGVTLPRGTILHGDLVLHPQVSIRHHVKFGAEVKIHAGVEIPEGVSIASRAIIRELRIGRRVRLPYGTLIEGNLELGDDVLVRTGVRFGSDVRVGARAMIGSEVFLPPDITVREGACINHLELDDTVQIEAGVTLCGDARLHANACIGTGAVLCAGVEIGPGVQLPPGVIVEQGARIDALHADRAHLPPGTRLSGNLRLGRRCHIGVGVRFGADVQIQNDVTLPDGIIVADRSHIRLLHLHGSRLPVGTTVAGNLHLGKGVRIGRGVRFGAGVRISSNVRIPGGVSIADGARISTLYAPADALPFGAQLHGDLVLADGVVVGRNVVFHAGVRIECACRIPDGLVFGSGTTVTRFVVAPDVRLPAGTVIEGNLWIAANVVIGTDVYLAANVAIGPGVNIPAGAHLAPDTQVCRIDIDASAVLPQRFGLGGDVVIGAAARIGEDSFLDAGCVIGSGVKIPPCMHVAPGACVNRLRIAADADLAAGTQISGDAAIGMDVSIAPGVVLGADVKIAPHVSVPAGVIVLAGAHLRRLQAPPDALPPGTMLAGDLSIGAGATIGTGVYFGAGVVVGKGARIASGIALPPGTQVLPQARIELLDIAERVGWPAHASVSGDLEVGEAAVIGEGVRFGASVRIGAGAVIGAGAIIEDGVSIAPGQVVPAGAQCHAMDRDGGIDVPSFDASLECWANYFGSMQVGGPVNDPPPMPASDEQNVRHSAPLAIPARPPQTPLWRPLT
jgi:UDP-3-O-[3-hydroxymyristoyl] glucosamine N-acyltransferase